MASGRPIVRQVKWIAVIPQLLILAGFIVLFRFFDYERGFFFGAAAYLLLSFGMKLTISGSHRKGIRLFKMGKYEEAIKEYEKSLDFFTRNKWIDDFRALTLLSASRISYIEMAMLNIAFCNGQIGNGEAAKKWYEKTLETFPDSEMARSAINLLESQKT